jgi:hypothetical protein
MLSSRVSAFLPVVPVEVFGCGVSHLRTSSVLGTHPSCPIFLDRWQSDSNNCGASSDLVHPLEMPLGSK